MEQYTANILQLQFEQILIWSTAHTEILIGWHVHWIDKALTLLSHQNLINSAHQAGGIQGVCLESKCDIKKHISYPRATLTVLIGQEGDRKKPNADEK